MKSQIRYNKPISFALLQTFLALNEGDEIDYEYFNEMTGFKEVTYKRVINLIDELTQDLHLKTGLVKTEEKVVTNKIEYLKAKYSFSTTDSWSFKLPEDLDEEKRITYLPVITYLKLKKDQYVSTSMLSEYFPNFTRDTMSNLIKGLKNVIGEELYKDEIQSYIIEEVE